MHNCTPTCAGGCPNGECERPNLCRCHEGFEPNDGLCMFKCMDGHTLDERECVSAMAIFAEQVARLMATTTTTTTAPTTTTTIGEEETTIAAAETTTATDGTQPSSSSSSAWLQEHTSNDGDSDLTETMSNAVYAAVPTVEAMLSLASQHTRLATEHWLLALLAAIAALTIAATVMISIAYRRRIDYDVKESEHKLGVHYNASNSILAYA